MDIRERFSRAPISHGAALVCFAYGVWVLAVNGYNQLQGAEMIPLLELAAKGPGGLLLGATFWSKAGTLIDIWLGFAEKKAEEA